MSRLKPYEPTPEDVQYFTNLITIRNGGMWGMKSAGLVYRIDHVRKVFTLVSPAWDDTPETMWCHHHNDYCLRKIGYTIEPVVDWENL